MGMLLCSLSLEDIIVLAAEKGLSSADVLEANVVYMVGVCKRKDVVDFIEAKLQVIASVPPESYVDTTVEKYLADLPGWLVAVTEVMEATGGLNTERGFQNWAVLEGVMADNDPDVKAFLEERDGKPAGIKFH